MPYSLYIYKFPPIFINSGKNELENKIQSLVGPNFCCHFFCHCNMILLFNTGPQPRNIYDLAYCCKDVLGGIDSCRGHIMSLGIAGLYLFS